MARMYIVLSGIGTTQQKRNTNKDGEGNGESIQGY